MIQRLGSAEPVASSAYQWPLHMAWASLQHGSFWTIELLTKGSELTE